MFNIQDDVRLDSNKIEVQIEADKSGNGREVEDEQHVDQVTARKSSDSASRAIKFEVEDILSNADNDCLKKNSKDLAVDDSGVNEETNSSQAIQIKNGLNLEGSNKSKADSGDTAIHDRESQLDGSIEPKSPLSADDETLATNFSPVSSPNIENAQSGQENNNLPREAGSKMRAMPSIQTEDIPQDAACACCTIS